MKNATFPDFTNKIVSVGLMDDDYGYRLHSPRFKMQGGRLFLVGTVPHGDTKSNWSEGAVIAVAWDRVTDYLIFDSMDHYLKGASKSRETKRKAKVETHSK